MSVDSLPCLQAWAKDLGDIHYPLLSDFYPHGAIAAKYGVLREEGFSERALFLVDKQGVVGYLDIHDINRRPDNDVVLAELRRIDPEAAARAAVTDTASRSRSFWSSMTRWWRRAVGR